MSDLYCAASLVVAPTATTEQTRALADLLGSRRVASVFCGDEEGLVLDAEFLGDRFRVPVTACASLREAAAGEPADAVVERHRAQFEEIADQFRGETVLVLADPEALGALVPALTGRPSRVEEDGPIELENDADGWVLV